MKADRCDATKVWSECNKVVRSKSSATVWRCCCCCEQPIDTCRTAYRFSIQSVSAVTCVAWKSKSAKLHGKRNSGANWGHESASFVRSAYTMKSN